MMNLRPYQSEAIRAIETGWKECDKELLVLPTGCGKTIVFSQVAANRAKRGRVLILAHRDELIEQARDKFTRLTGQQTAKEKASETCIGSDLPVVVGSVQTMMTEKRLSRFEPDYFDTIIVDEAHHSLSASYQNILNYFPWAKVLGVTATPDRGDKKSLGKVYDRIAYEYPLRKAIEEGYLCRIAARTVPLQIDMRDVKVKVGDFEVNSIAETLEPYLPEIAKAIAKYAGDRKVVVFLPLISIAQEFKNILVGYGLDAQEVNGNSPDRKEILDWFDKAGPGTVLCNAMLLTEGWDCPSVDCIVVLRPTKIRSLYVQMIGRGTRPSPGKKDLLILDFLWMVTKHNLCKPASLAGENEDDIEYVTKKSQEDDIDLFGAMTDAVEARRQALAEALARQKAKKSKMVDPLAYFVSIGDTELMDYQPCFAWEEDKPTEKQLQVIEHAGVDPSQVKSKGQASVIIDKIMRRRNENLATAKQVQMLLKQGYADAPNWTKDKASKMIGQIMKGWKH